MIRAAILSFIAAIAAHGAVLEGIILDDETGNPLARTVVTLQPLPGTPAGMVSLRSGERGAFTILSVRPGWYVLKTSRRGFADSESGQVRPGRPGTAFEIVSDTISKFVEIRMKRLAAITGTVLDENNVGIPDWAVHIYTANKPVRRIAEIKTDDRGVYRIGGLEGGRYVVRSGPGQLEDETPLLPTYYKYGTALETSEPLRLRVGETQPDVAVRPVKGKLLTLNGVFSSNVAARLTLITDTGRRQIASLPGPPATSVPFSAGNVPPGLIELFAEGTDPRPELNCGAYIHMSVEKDADGIRVACGPVSSGGIFFLTDDGRRLNGAFPILARRVDLDGTGPPRTLTPRQPLEPGHWEVMAQVPPEFYVKALRLQGATQMLDRNDGWFGMYLGNQAGYMFTLSQRPARVSGAVSTGGRAVAGAAVYLEQFNPDLPDPRLQLRTIRSDSTGNYAFDGLQPGRYRILSSFDFDPDDRDVMQRAPAFTLNEGDAASQSIEMIVP